MKDTLRAYPAFPFNAKPDPAFHFNPDPDPDPDPVPEQSETNLRQLVYELMKTTFVVNTW